MIRRLTLESRAGRLSATDLLPVLDGQQVEPMTRLRVATWSMFPTLHKGDLLEVEAVTAICHGDIIVFRRGPVLICHRVTGFGRNGEVLTAGDRSLEPSEAVLRTDVLAKVRAIRRRGKRLAADSAPPASAARLRMVLDCALMAGQAAWRDLAEMVWNRFRRTSGGRTLLSALLRRLARAHVLRHPALRSLGASPLVSRETIRLDALERLPLVHPAWAAGPVRFEVRLGPYLLGTGDPATGELAIQPPAQGLGLEQVFHKLMQPQHGHAKPNGEYAGTWLTPPA